MEKFISNSIEETKRFGKELAKELNKGDVIILNGDLGAGKTALVTGVAKGKKLSLMKLSKNTIFPTKQTQK